MPPTAPLAPTAAAGRARRHHAVRLPTLLCATSCAVDQGAGPQAAADVGGADDTSRPMSPDPDAGKDAGKDTGAADGSLTDAEEPLGKVLPPPFPYLRPAALDAAASRDPAEVCEEYCTYIVDCLGPHCPDAGYDQAYIVGCAAGCVDAEYDPVGLVRTMVELDCADFTTNICGGYPEIAAMCNCPVPPPITENNVGAACMTHAECKAGPQPTTCFGIERNSPPWPGGYCTANLCGSDADCGPDNICQWREDTSLCYAGCDPRQGRAGCRTRYTCWPIESGDRGVCAPDCDQIPCPAGASCDGMTGLCFSL